MEPFNDEKQRAYTEAAKSRWGTTDAWKEYEQKSKGRSRDDRKRLGTQMMQLFADLGACKASDPAGPEAQAGVAALQQFITDHYYTCTPQILSFLGRMYAEGGEMTDNIDRAGGPGTADFAAAAIDCYCR